MGTRYGQSRPCGKGGGVNPALRRGCAGIVEMRGTQTRGGGSAVLGRDGWVDGEAVRASTLRWGERGGGPTKVVRAVAG